MMGAGGIVGCLEQIDMGLMGKREGLGNSALPVGEDRFVFSREGWSE